MGKQKKNSNNTIYLNRPIQNEDRGLDRYIYICGQVGCGGGCRCKNRSGDI